MPSETFARLAALAPRERRADANPASPREDPACALPSAIDLERDFGLFATDVVAHHASSSSSSSSSPSPACAPAVDARGVVSCACAGALVGARSAGRARRTRAPPRAAAVRVLTREHVGALAAHSLASERARPSSAAPGVARAPPTPPRARVLEVGAGDGRLATHVRAAIDAIERRREGGRGEDEDVPRVAIVAVDDDSLGLRRPRDDGALLRFVTMDAIEALAPGALVFPGDDGDGGDPGDRPGDHPGDRPGDVSPAPGPDLVLACWHPMGVDWTAAMRANASVAEYVLVGEADDGMCGRPWETWGYNGGDGDIPGDGDGDGTPPVPPYVRDGFERGDVAGVSGASQICRADERWRGTRRSRTVSFRRVTGPGAVGGGRGRSVAGS